MKGLPKGVRLGGQFQALRLECIPQGGRNLHRRKRHIDAGAGVAVGVFQLGFGQGGAGTGAPVHGLQAPVDVALEHHLAEHLDLGGFVLLLQREIGLLPVGPDAPALEALHLAIHLLAGVSSGFLAQLDRCQRFALFLIHGLQHLEFDRQAVAVPAGHVAHPAALEHLILIDHILEHLVEGMPHVQGPVGIGRSVVKGERGPVVLEPQLSIDAVVAPEGLQFRFALHRIGAHAETGLQQVERVLVGGTSLSGGVARLLAHWVPGLAWGLSVFTLATGGFRAGLGHGRRFRLRCVH